LPGVCRARAGLVQLVPACWENAVGVLSCWRWRTLSAPSRPHSVLVAPAASRAGPSTSRRWALLRIGLRRFIIEACKLINPPQLRKHDEHCAQQRRPERELD